MDLINCFGWISDLSTRVYEENLKSIEFIKKFNDLKAPKKILLTHYLPFNKSVSYKFKGHSANNFYVCDLSKYLNELNYEYQNKQFNFNKIIEV